MSPPPPAKPLLIWDGDCSFCRRWITRWKHLTGDAIDYEPYQTAAERVPSVPRKEFGRSVFLVEPDGSVSRAAAAVFRSLALAGQKRYLAWLYDHVPPFRWASELGYRVVARGRNWIDPIDRLIVGTETRPATYQLTRAVFLRLIGVIYLIAFVSLFTQIDGLVGSNGILPAAPYLEAVTKAVGANRWWQAPTLLYLNASDARLHALCVVGIIGSSLLIIGVAPLLMTIVLWASYLSLAVACQTFLNFQWDALLLEAGFLAILWSPPLWAGPKTSSEPSRVVLYLLRWLLFRLMFLSALTKWIWRDECWRDMTALRYHFETQPLPTWTKLYAHHSPHWMLAAGCAGMFIIEFIVPFFYFFPRRMRMLGFWLTVLLQVNIMATGNYGFFNLLTIVLTVTLLDDAALARVFRIRELAPRRIGHLPILRPIAVWPLSVVIFVVTTMALAETWKRDAIGWPKWMAKVQEWVSPFRSTNSYGLFRVMTRDRPEIVIEGSDDGQTWKEYSFRYKMGDLSRRPGFLIGHMPRLDWQMWFAGVNPLRERHWFESFVVRLLNGQPEVLGLLGENPFPDHPPTYVRAMMYDYRFVKPGGKGWWERRPLGFLLPPASLRRETATPTSTPTN